MAIYSISSEYKKAMSRRIAFSPTLEGQRRKALTRLHTRHFLNYGARATYAEIDDALVTVNNPSGEGWMFSLKEDVRKFQCYQNYFLSIYLWSPIKEWLGETPYVTKERTITVLGEFDPGVAEWENPKPEKQHRKIVAELRENREAFVRWIPEYLKPFPRNVLTASLGLAAKKEPFVQCRGYTFVRQVFNDVLCVLGARSKFVSAGWGLLMENDKHEPLNRTCLYLRTDIGEALIASYAGDMACLPWRRRNPNQGVFKNGRRIDLGEDEETL